MLEWYLKVVKENYANFEGRARRSEYWYFALVNIIISVILGVIDSVIGISVLGGIYSLAVLVPSIAVGVRRMHDIGKSGWYLLVALIPIAGIIWLLVLLCKEGDTGPNEYGADPKNPTFGEFDEIGRPDVF
jgi:uncharacterized membrane protein YhaH (DUF805 family)